MLMCQKQYAYLATTRQMMLILDSAKLSLLPTRQWHYDCRAISCTSFDVSLTCLESLTYSRYGVCRVYDQKCQYVLKDAEQARDKMRMLFKVVRNADLDPEAGRAARLVFMCLRSLMSGRMLTSFHKTRTASPPR